MQAKEDGLGIDQRFRKHTLLIRQKREGGGGTTRTDHSARKMSTDFALTICSKHFKRDALTHSITNVNKNKKSEKPSNIVDYVTRGTAIHVSLEYVIQKLRHFPSWELGDWEFLGNRLVLHPNPTFIFSPSDSFNLSDRGMEQSFNRWPVGSINELLLQNRPWGLLCTLLELYFWSFWKIPFLSNLEYGLNVVFFF